VKQHLKFAAFFVAAVLFVGGVITQLSACSEAHASPKTTLKSSYDSIKYVEITGIDARSTTGVTSAKSIADAGTEGAIVVTTASVPVPGRNLVVTFDDASLDGGTTGKADGGLDATLRVTCYDQFRATVVEDFTTTGGEGQVDGSKICSQVISAKFTSRARTAAADRVSIGYGHKVGLPFQFSKDLREIKRADVTNAAGTTTTPKTVNTTNFDYTYFAAKGNLFTTDGGVTDGDTLKLLVETDNYSPDDRYYPTR
jgi:hypothetical protein